MSNRPKVSVGLPVFNGENYLEETIRSILDQDLEDLELIIGDNGSTDRTEEICRAALADPRVRYDRSPTNRGATWNYNRLVDMARADYFKWAAHDDLLAPTYLRVCADELDRSSEAVIAYPQTVLIDDAGAVTDSEFVDGLDLRDPDPVDRLRRYLVHPGEQHAVFGLLRMEALRRTRLIENCWGGDQVLLVSLLLQGSFHEVGGRLFLRRYHAGTSLVANPTPADVARWFDPNKRVLAVMPRTRLTAEFFRVILAADLPARSRLRAAAAVLGRWVPKYWRVIGGEVKATARTGLVTIGRRAS